MRPRANTISHVDGAAMQMLAASDAPVARMAHSRHPSLIGLPVHNLDHVYGGMAAALGQRGLQHGLPKLETSQMGVVDFDAGGLRTAPPMGLFSSEFDFENFVFRDSTINPNALHYDSPPSLALDQMSGFPSNLTDLSSSQQFDDGLDWVQGFDHQMSFANENAVDGSSPSAISTTSQSGISDVMVDGSNHPAPTGTSAMWHPSVMGPPQMPNPFAMDLNGPVFPDLLSGAPLSPQPAAQKIVDPYFSAPPLSTLLVSGMRPQDLKNPASGFNADSDTSPLPDRRYHSVTTITDATRNSIVTTLSHCVPFGSRNVSSYSSLGSSRSPRVALGRDSSSPTGPASNPTIDVPSTQDLQRYIRAYLTCFHPHLPFLHLPTLSFDVSPDSIGNPHGLGGKRCLLVAMAAFGAAYELDYAQSKELFEMAKKMVFFYLEERRRLDVRKADIRRSTVATELKPKKDQMSPSIPLWLVQAMLLNVIYGHTCSDKVTSDIAFTHFSALVSLSQSAGLVERGRAHVPAAQSNAQTTGGPDWTGSLTEQQRQHKEWLEWKSMEESKRTVFVIFILSSLATASFNHSPALTNSEIPLDLPCDEEFFDAETGVAFAAKGGIEAASHNRLTFYAALGDLLCANGRHQKMSAAGYHSQIQTIGSTVTLTPSPDASLTDMRPSTFGCLVLIYALHNYIWETRQRHQDRVWTSAESEKMHSHIEPALKAWQVAWSSNPQHSIERPNPFGAGPMSADAIPLLDLAYVKLFVDTGPAKEKLWQRDWAGMVDELSNHYEAPSPTRASDSGVDVWSESVMTNDFMESPRAQHLFNPSSDDKKPLASDDNGDGSGRAMTKREEYLRTASGYAVDSLLMSDRLGVSFADKTSHELPMQTALCTAECAHVIAGWITVLQERVGAYLGIIGQDVTDFNQVPAVILLEEEDIKLLSKVKDMLAVAELKMGVRLAGTGTAVESVLAPDAFNGYAAKMLRLAAWMVKSAVWPVADVAAHGLETYATNVRMRAEKSVVGFVSMAM